MKAVGFHAPLFYEKRSSKIRGLADKYMLIRQPSNSHDIQMQFS